MANLLTTPFPLRQPETIPVTPEEFFGLKSIGWPKELDILLLSGDALVDHPSFGAALLARHLIANGFSVAVAAQPVWETADAMRRFPRPRLFGAVTAGAIDSMLAHYTAFRKKRHDDAYTPGGKAGARPNRAAIVYTNLLRQAFPEIPVVLGGLEASLRRLSHYDFWSDSLRRPLLLDSKADLLVYGMGEQALLQLARIAEKLSVDGALPNKFRKAFAEASREVRGVVRVLGKGENAEDATGGAPLIRLPGYEEILADPFELVRATSASELAFHQGVAFLAQSCGDRTVLVAPPAESLSEAELDALYDLPFSRLPHPSYQEAVPAWEMIRTSITTHRGCGGGCSFCSLAQHQGRGLASRSRESILREAEAVTSLRVGGKTPRWASSISDVGGPSANMWRGKCSLEQQKRARCARASCLFPDWCPNFKVNQKEAVDLLRTIARQKNVRHVRVASGVRFDMALRDPEAMRAYTQEFTGGQLKVAPEHIADPVLKLMRKPSSRVFEEFIAAFRRLSDEAGKEQYVVPYLISAFPGCTPEHMSELAAWFGERGWSPAQAQCFIPTPGTLATAMYYSAKDPEGRPLFVARSDAERLRLHYMLPGRGGQKQGGEKMERRARKNYAGRGRRS